MTTDFTFFEGAATVNSTTPRVTVRKTGQLVLTEAAVAMLGEGVEAVQIGFDPKARAVGIKPAASTNSAPSAASRSWSRCSPTSAATASAP